MELKLTNLSLERLILHELSFSSHRRLEITFSIKLSLEMSKKKKKLEYSESEKKRFKKNFGKSRILHVNF